MFAITQRPQGGPVPFLRGGHSVAAPGRLVCVSPSGECLTLFGFLGEQFLTPDRRTVFQTWCCRGRFFGLRGAGRRGFVAAICLEIPSEHVPNFATGPNKGPPTAAFASCRKCHGASRGTGHASQQPFLKGLFRKRQPALRRSFGMYTLVLWLEFDT